eukprot:366401-Chlamydomonas_euryale.AAC.7
MHSSASNDTIVLLPCAWQCPSVRPRHRQPMCWNKGMEAMCGTERYGSDVWNRGMVAMCGTEVWKRRVDRVAYTKHSSAQVKHAQTSSASFGKQPCNKWPMEELFRKSACTAFCRWRSFLGIPPALPRVNGEAFQ